ncbi:CFI-box-CTERM domain-containing protein [Nitrosopumilus sp. S6]
MKSVIIIALVFVLLIPIPVFAQTAEEMWKEARYAQLMEGMGHEFNNGPAGDYLSKVKECLSFASEQDNFAYGGALANNDYGSAFLILERLCPYHEEEFRLYLNLETDVESNSCNDFKFGQYASLDDYPLISNLLEQGLNEKNQETGKIIVDNYKNTLQYESECNSLWNEFQKIRVESQNWNDNCSNFGNYVNAKQLENMYHTMNGVCGFATLVAVEQTDESEIACGVGTIEKDGICIADPNYKSLESSSRGGGCLIATATYGTELAPQVQQLRELRDNQLFNTESGTKFMKNFNDFYYSFSPVIADYERENPAFREMVKVAITPMIASLSILNYVDMDSEAEVLGYGISLIMLNVMMYVGIPVLALMRFSKSHGQT